jgi:hypothetical protein
LSCATDAQLFVSPARKPGEREAWTLSEDPLLLPSTVVTDGLRVELGHQFKVVEDTAAASSNRWHCSTLAYQYRVDRGVGGELLSWHWHPHTGVPFPHLHVSGASLSRKAHLPSGRVSVEAVLRFLISDLRAPARRADWTDVLDRAERPFLDYRRWS